jgi:hypothetical protein
MDNPEKLASSSTQDEDKQNTTLYVLDNTRYSLTFIYGNALAQLSSYPLLLFTDFFV